ncbi:MAG: glycerophosphodiester phosphodiesterase, partial [Myxococcota bacterium]
LAAFGERVDFNLELKHAGHGAYAGLEAQVLEEVESRGLLTRTLFSCFFDDVLERLRGLCASARLAVLVDPRMPEGWRARCLSLGAEAVNFHWRIAGPENIESAHAADLAVNVYTVDRRELLEELVTRGVDGIFTNYPDRLRALLDDSAAR